MDRRGDRRTWRSARHHPRKLRPRRFLATSPTRPGAFSACRRPDPAPDHARPSSSAPAGSPESARRLFAMSQPISGTIAETYLRRRGITALHGTGNLRFHPRCYYRPDPALADRDLAGDDRRRHRPRRHDHRRAPHLARPVGARTRRRSTRRGGRWAISWAMPSASVWRTMSWRLARASRPCCRSDASCPPCRWWRRSRPRISPPSCSPGRCAGSTSPATTIRPAMARWRT